MPELRERLADFFARLGGKLFGTLSGLEERRILPEAARWAKFTFLGVFVTLLGALPVEAREDVIMCYKPAPLPPVTISDISVRPSPTKGADSVTVRATASITPLYYEADSKITKAFMHLASDTLFFQMQPADSTFGDTVETLEGRLYVGDLPDETTWVYVEVVTSYDRTAQSSVQLIVSEPDTVTGSQEE